LGFGGGSEDSAPRSGEIADERAASAINDANCCNLDMRFSFSWVPVHERECQDRQKGKVESTRPSAHEATTAPARRQANLAELERGGTGP